MAENGGGGQSVDTDFAETVFEREARIACIVGFLEHVHALEELHLLCLQRLVLLDPVFELFERWDRRRNGAQLVKVADLALALRVLALVGLRLREEDLLAQLGVGRTGES